MALNLKSSREICSVLSKNVLRKIDFFLAKTNEWFGLSFEWKQTAVREPVVFRLVNRKWTSIITGPPQSLFPPTLWLCLSRD